MELSCWRPEAWTRRNTYVFEVVARGVTESGSKSLQYWSTGNGDDTMVAVWNPADEAQDFVFTLYFTGGHYIVPLHLEARATRTFNVSEIVQNQVPDAEGNVIPASVHEGTAKIAGSRAENEIFSSGLIRGSTMCVRQPATVTAWSVMAIPRQQLTPTRLRLGSMVPSSSTSSARGMRKPVLPFGRLEQYR